jgi:hypothetical protein
MLEACKLSLVASVLAGRLYSISPVFPLFRLESVKVHRPIQRNQRMDSAVELERMADKILQDRRERQF